MITVSEAKQAAVHYYQTGDFQRAEEACRKILKADPNNPDSWYNLTVIAHQTGNYKTAVDLIRMAIELSPQHPGYYIHLGLNLKCLGKTAEAVNAFQQAIDINPNMANAYNYLGVALGSAGKLDSAIETFKQAIKIDSGFAQAHNNLGVALKAIGRNDSALVEFRKAVELDPEYVEAHWNLSFILLLKGEFEEGWREYEWRLKRDNWSGSFKQSPPIPHWNGTPFKGKRLLVFDEQGLGDTLQFVRYLQMVKALGGTVVFETRGPMLALLRHLSGIDQIVERISDDGAVAGCDLQIPLLSLPGLFNTTLDAIPADVPYIHPDPLRVSFWQHQMKGPGFRIGIVWEGNSTDPNRSCKLKQFAPLAEVKGLRLFGLQKGQASWQVNDLPQKMVVTNMGEDLNDFADTAGVLQNLDLIITIDTAVAHLAGGMGKPVFTLLPFAADWRWLLNRKDTPWYPTMRLFRQERPGNWDSVIRRMVKEVNALRSEIIQGGRRLMFEN